MLGLMLAPAIAQAGTFTLNWTGTPPTDWPSNSFGPNTYTLTDQYGFQLNAIFAITAANGVVPGAYPNYPDDTTGLLGPRRAVGVIWDPNSGFAGIGESRVTATMTLQSGGVNLPVDGLSFRLSDVDSSDNDQSTDRCDYVTVTGNNGNPTLTAVTGTPTFTIGPAAGLGNTPALASNQAQCLYTIGATAAPNSNGDDNGTIGIAFPSGTSVATVTYDESIENVYNQTSRDASLRGIAFWDTVAVVMNDVGALTVAKSTTSTGYETLGQTIPYTFVVTNSGRLPIRTTQDIRIVDSRLGTFTCATGVAVPVGGTVTCTRSHTVTPADMAATGVTNTAAADVGLIGNTTTRLQSNSVSVTVPRIVTGTFTITKATSPANEPGTFSFSASAPGATVAATPAAFTLAHGQAQAITTKFPAGTTQTLTVTEALLAGFNPTAAFSCTGTGITQTPATRTVSVAFTATNVAAACTITNTLTPVSSATIAKTQSSGPNPVTAAGAVVGYQITVVNTGNQGLTAPSVADTLPSGAAGTPTYVSGNTDGDTVLDRGETWIYAISYTVTQADMDGLTQLVNTARFTSTQTPTAITASATTPITKSPAATIAKTQTAGPNPVTAAGEVLTYGIAVRNTGNVSLNAPSVTDTLPSGAAGSPTYASGDTVADGRISVGETWIYTIGYTVTQANIDGTGPLVDTARFTSTEITTPIVATASTPVTRTATLTIVKQADPFYEPATFSFTVSASAPGAAPSPTTFTLVHGQSQTIAAAFDTTGQRQITVSEDALADWNATGAVCTRPDGSTFTSVTFDVPTRSGTFTFTEADRSATCTVTNTLTRQPAVTLAKTQTAGPNPVTAAGQTLGYTITVGNTGNVSLVSPVVSDTLPSGATATPTYVSGDADGDGRIDRTETWTYSVGYTVTQANIDGAGPLVDTARFTSAEITTPVVAAASTPVTRTPALVVVKTADDTTEVVAGQPVVYTFRVTNAGNQTLTSISLADVHNAFGPPLTPATETLVTDASPAGDSSDAAQNGIWDTLRPGDVVRFRATYTVTQEDVDKLQ